MAVKEVGACGNEASLLSRLWAMVLRLSSAMLSDQCYWSRGGRRQRCCWGQEEITERGEKRVVRGLCIAVGGSSDSATVRDNIATKEVAARWGYKQQMGAMIATSKEEAGCGWSDNREGIGSRLQQ
ncbi:hypothetical protein GW17_00022191 [Ensete ventricosum]|nr:hypothetical protein GW17_00022191 [Ensete ventricosum]RZS12914.1 hypothetical protein BHM03_00044438 [Ensete ventricosum]